MFIRMLLIISFILTLYHPVCGWELIFRQTYGAGYFSYADWYFNTHNPDALLYSRLGDLEQFRGGDGAFHLYLYYPELNTGNEWKQTSNPVATRSMGVTGYQPINVSLTGHDWGGLEFNNVDCLLDGSINVDNWWFAIGSFADFRGGIPADDNDEYVHQVELYVKRDISSNIKFGPIFQSGMVLQAGMENRVWGVATVPGEFYEVELFNGEELKFIISSVVEEDLTWEVVLPAQDYGTGYRLVVTAKNIIAINNLAFGEVWICSGQSNMEYNMGAVLDSENEIASSVGYDDVRFAKVNYMTASEEMTDIWGGLSIPWSQPSSINQLAGFSAVCFLFGRTLYDTLPETLGEPVPIGLIESAWGGTNVESWCDEAALASCGVPPSPDLGAGNQNENSQLWHAMIAPLTKLTVKGGIWYQGENNVWYNTDLYACTFSKMIDSWREAWSTNTYNQMPRNFPFGLVQLGTNREQVSDNNPNSNWPLIRWHQTGDAGSVPNDMLPYTFMATAVDTHDPQSPWGVIHPRDKLTVATRLAWACLNQAYSVPAYPSKGPQPTIHQVGELTYEVVYDQTVEVMSLEGWQVCTAPDYHLCSAYQGWQDISALSFTSDTVTLDLSQVCQQGCSALAYLWRETPCLTPLQCPVYAVDQFRLPATPWIFPLHH